MFFTCKLHSSRYLSVAFQSNIGKCSAGLFDLGIVCNGLALLTTLSFSVIAIISALVGLVAAYIITWVMLCSVAIFLSFIETASCWVCLFSIF